MPTAPTPTPPARCALSGDWVTLRVNNVRYLEKAPLPYWIAAASFRVFGCNTFAAHLPQALAVLLLMLLGYRWARESFGERAALYTGLGVLTSTGVFLFTRVLIPDVLLSLLLAACLYCFLKSLSSASSNLYPYAFWTSLALAVLTKGLVAIVFLAGTAIVYLALTSESRNWRRLKPFTGTLLFLVIAAPWHILAGLRNTGGMDGHGFFWFYFINEHVLRFLGRRIPRDYNKLPGYLYWASIWSGCSPGASSSATLLRRRHPPLAPLRPHPSRPPLLRHALDPRRLLLPTIAITGPLKGIIVAFPLACLAAWGAWRNRRTGPWYARHPQPLADLTPASAPRCCLPFFPSSFSPFSRSPPTRSTTPSPPISRC